MEVIRDRDGEKLEVLYSLGAGSEQMEHLEHRQAIRHLTFEAHATYEFA
jgi:hypothetical protein